MYPPKEGIKNPKIKIRFHCLMFIAIFNVTMITTLV